MVEDPACRWLLDQLTTLPETTFREVVTPPVLPPELGPTVVPLNLLVPAIDEALDAYIEQEPYQDPEARRMVKRCLQTPLHPSLSIPIGW